MSTIQESYTAHVTTLRKLGAALSAAVDARYEAPPQTPRSKDSSIGGVRNPTLDIVLDPRRMAVSTEIDSAASTLRAITAQLRPHIDALSQAVAAWEGQEGPPAP